MLSFAADENFNIHIVNGVLRRLPAADIVRVQDANLEGADDPTVLEWAASEGRVLLSHDVNTLTAFAYERVAQGLPMPGVFEISLRVPMRRSMPETTVRGSHESDKVMREQPNRNVPPCSCRA